MNLFVLRIA